MKNSKKIMAVSMATAMTLGSMSSVFALDVDGTPYSGAQVGDKYYSVQYIASHADQFEAAIQGQMNNLILDINGNSAKLMDFVTSGADDFDIWAADPANQTAVNPTTLVEADGSETSLSKDLAVESVSAVNAMEVEVKFNKAMGDSAEVASNYTVDGTAFTGTVLLSEDKETATLTFAVTPGQQVTKTIGVTKNVKTVDNESLAEIYSQDVTFFDTTVPVVIGAELTSPTNIRVTLSEPVSVSGTLKNAFILNNGTYSISNAAQVGATNPRAVDLTVPTLAVGEYSLKINKTGIASGDTLKDGAGFKIADDTVLTFTVNTDSIAPTASIKELHETTAVIMLDEEVQMAATGTLNTDFTVYHSYNKVANYKGTATLGADNKTLTVTFSNTPIPQGNVTLYLNNSTDASKQLEDMWGNKFETTTLTGTVAVDNTAPTVVDAQIVNGKIEVEFSETVSNGTALSNYTLTKDGSPVTITGVSLKSGETKVYELTATITGGTYTLSVNGIKDTAYVQNTMTQAYTKALSIADSVKPTVTTTGYTETAAATAKKIKINFSETMKTEGEGSVLNLDNYVWSAGTWPIGTTIALDGTKSVIITLPTGASIDSTTVQVGRVADVSGNFTASLATTVNINAETFAVANLVGASTKAITTTKVTLEVDKELSSIDAAGFTVNSASVTAASYVNQKVNSGAVDGALVTLEVASGDKWLTDATPAVTFDTNAMTTVFGTKYLDASDGTVGGGTDAVGNADDYMAPQLVADSIETADTDSNGKIDQIKVVYSEDLYDATAALATWTVEGYEVTAVDESADDGTVLLTVKEITTGYDTNATPNISQALPIKDNSAAKNTLAGAVLGNATDKAGAVVIAVNLPGDGAVDEKLEDGDVIEVVFSETLDTLPAGVTGAGAFGNGGGVGTVMTITGLGDFAGISAATGGGTETTWTGTAALSSTNVTGDTVGVTVTTVNGTQLITVTPATVDFTDDAGVNVTDTATNEVINTLPAVVVDPSTDF